MTVKTEEEEGQGSSAAQSETLARQESDDDILHLMSEQEK